jgi:hypothetical protein
VQQPAVRHAADIRPVDGTESSSGLMPGGSCFGGGGGGFGSDRVGGMVVAGQFPVRADRAGPLLPVPPVRRVRGHRSEGSHGPGQGMVGDVFADAVFAGVHQRGDLGEVRAAFGVGDGRNLAGPRAGRERDEGSEVLAEAGVDDGGDVAGAGQVPFGDHIGEGLGGVLAAEFGGSQGPPQPLSL